MQTLDFIRLFTAHYTYLKQKDVKIQKVETTPTKSPYNSPKMCFHNSYLHMSDLMVDSVESFYVLGFIMVGEIPVEHALVRVGEVYQDVTVLDKSHEFYTVLEMDWRQLIDCIEQIGYPPGLHECNRLARFAK